MDRYEEVKRELKRLKAALPKLPSSSKLYDDIVLSCQNVMLVIERFDQLKEKTHVFYNSNLSYGELEREARIMELETENCKTCLQSFVKHLRLLYSSVPLLIATRAISSRAWESKMEVPQRYYTRNGERKTLLVSQEDVERIAKDQLEGIEEFFGTLRPLKAETLSQERALHESTYKEVLKAINSMDLAMKRVQEEVGKMERAPAPPAPVMVDVAIEARPDDERARIADNVEFMEAVHEEEESDEEDAALGREIERLEAELAQVSRRRRELARRKVCRPREYLAGIYRREEEEMPCAFCGALGRHYSDSCNRIRTGQERAQYLRRTRRCQMCLERECEGDSDCAKAKIPCFHCKRMGHASAVCTLPGVSLQIEADKRHCELAIDATHGFDTSVH
ncbi:unnamed protein product [Haemonchus placei]|uniref:CCHC-type domain-containing protein n=1 Tax=Haemonchus placei TaxID=6290 RepID=A0A0N4VRY6_HAEPC|nr:unnamed protein product [Haemonchus placei]